MKKIKQIMGKLFRILSSFGLLLAVLFPIYFFGKPLLDGLGILRYDPPLNQPTENIVRIELYGKASSADPILLYTLADEEKDAFLSNFLKIRSGRYANDPPTVFGEKLVAIIYADGCRDMIGEEINAYLSPDGTSLPAGGWYWLPEETLDSLFEKYIP